MVTRKALIVTYYWPPGGGGGVQRVAKFCKYMPRNGWEPVVLTVRNGNFPHYDPSLERDVADVAKVHYARTLEPHALYNMLCRKPRYTGSEEHTAARPGRSPEWMRKLGEYVRLNLFVPDSRIGWLRPACSMGADIIAREKPDIIFSSAPPYTAHLVAGKLHKRFGLPWVADFRDPWFENLAYNTVPRLRLVQAVTRRLEAGVLARAERVLTVGDRLQKLLQSKMPPAKRAKVSVITNGYDSDDIVTRKHDDSGQFDLSFFGTLYSNGFPTALLQAVRLLAEEDGDFARDYAIRLTGHVPQDVAARMVELVPAAKVHLQRYIPHDNMLELLYRPQVLLLVVNDVPRSELIITGKIFDYLPTGNPIVGLGPCDGDAAAVIRRTGAGQMFDHADIDGIKACIKARYADWRAGRLSSGIRRFPAYTREVLTVRLTELFDRMINV